jgi:hypothetical protein
MKNYKIILLTGLVFVVLAMIFTSIGLYFGKNLLDCNRVTQDKVSVIDRDNGFITGDKRLLKESQIRPDLSKYNWDSPSPKDANKMEVFKAPGFEIKFSIPYNDEWAHPDYPIQPYTSAHYGISLVSVRYNLQNSSSPTELFQFTADYRYEPEDTDEIVKIGNFNVIKSVEEDLCYHPQMVVVGKHYNYKFRSLCTDADQIESHFNYLEEIIESMEYYHDNRIPMFYKVADRERIFTDIQIESADYSAEYLEGLAAECGTKSVKGDFQIETKKLEGAEKSVYSFMYTGASQESDTYVVTIMPNAMGYSTLAEFKKDFDFCAAGGSEYPIKMNENWLMFENSCGSGFDDGSGKPNGCQIAKDEVGSTIELY